MDSLARFFFLIILAERTIGTEIVNSPSLTLTNVMIGNYTVLCVAKGRPAPKLMILHHLSETSFNVTANLTTPPSGKDEQFTSRIEYLYRCTSASSNRLVKCCDDRKLCTDRTLPPCPVKNSPSLTLTKANGTYTVLCVAKGRPAPKLSLVHHPPVTSFNVTRYVTTSPSGEEEQFTSKIEFLYTCTQGSFNRSVKCCDDSKLCTNRTLPSCQDSTETNNTGVQHTPHGSTGGVTLDDTSSASPTSMTTTFPSKAHTSLADRWETKLWLVPLTIVATIVGAVIVIVVIAFLISLTQSRASKQQGPLVNGVLQLGNNAVQERYEMNADEENGPHDTAVYANVPAELTNAPNTQSSHTASLALGPDTACNALDPDTACNALYLTKN